MPSLERSNRMDKFEGILRRMEETYERESGCKIEDVSDVGLRMRALAGELYRLEEIGRAHV